MINIMGDLMGYVEMIKRVVDIEQGNDNPVGYTQIFKFPYSDDYKRWMDKKLKTFPSSGRRWDRLYTEIIKKEINPQSVTIPFEWYNKIISFPTNCVYMIGNENENIVYIGKSEFPAIIRVLDFMVPKCSSKYPNGQNMNNIPQIWDDILSNHHFVKCFYCYDLSFDPDILKYFLLSEYKMINYKLPIYNKIMPDSKVLPKVKKLRKLIYES